MHCLPIADHDHHSPDELVEIAGELGFEATANTSLEQALGQLKRPARVLVFGSLYLAGEALRANGEVPD